VPSSSDWCPWGRRTRPRLSTTSTTTTAATTGWYDGHAAKDSSTDIYRDAVLRRSAVQLTSLSAVVDEKSFFNEKSAIPDWRLGGSPDEPL